MECVYGLCVCVCACDRAENILGLERDYRMWLWGVIGIFFGGMGFCIRVVNSNFAMVRVG